MVGGRSGLIPFVLRCLAGCCEGEALRGTPVFVFRGYTSVVRGIVLKLRGCRGTIGDNYMNGRFITSDFVGGASYSPSCIYEMTLLGSVGVKMLRSYGIGRLCVVKSTAVRLDDSGCCTRAVRIRGVGMLECLVGLSGALRMWFS